MTRQELHELACRTRDPSTLSDEVIAEMKAARVGPWQHSPEEWQKSFDEVFAEDRFSSFERDQRELKTRFPKAGIK